MLVKDAMCTNPVSVKSSQTVEEAAKLMSVYNVGCLPVTNDHGVAGIVTDRDIVLRCTSQGKDPSKTAVCAVMTESATAVAPGHSLGTAAELMAAHQIRRLPVVEDGRLEGMLSLSDVAKASGEREAAKAFGCIIR